MNRTNFEHAGYSLLMLLGCWALTQDAMAGVCFGIAFFLGREHAQAQRSHEFGDFEAFEVWKWSLDSQLDLLFPIISCVSLGTLIRFMGWWRP